MFLDTKTRKIFTAVLVISAATTLFAAGCSKQNENDLKRPNVEEQNKTSSEQTQSVNKEEGAVAGSITLPTKKILVGTQELNVEIADTDEARTQGLSGRENLAEGTGMIFDFSKSDFKTPGFWMKDMLISIDIIWINNDKVIGLVESAPVPPEDKDLDVYYPPSEITHVLEVPAGWSAKNKVTIGSKISL